MSEQKKGRAWVYTASVKGRFQRLHRLSGLALQLILFVTPWVTIGGYPAFRLDLPGRRLFALGATFTPRDTIFLVLLLLFGAFSLFLFTSLFGRLWCGYACPQTVFLEEWVRPIEKVIEGDRARRMARDRGPWNFDKAWRKVLKNTLYAALAVVVGATFMSWFVDPRLLWTGEASGVAYGLTGFFSAVMFADFSWFREQFCNYLCPYARFQGALTDDESKVVAYNVVLGEPRRTRGDAAATGACIDCGKCVAVCPQGIDIRKGYQLECVNCARCVDACEGVMDKLGHEPLIRYTTVAADQGKEARLLRPRTVLYSAVLFLIATVFTVQLTDRHDIEGAVNRVPGALYTLDADGWVRNTFLLEVTNNHGVPGGDPDTITVSIEGLPDAQVIIPPIALGHTESTRMPLVVRVPPDTQIGRTANIEVRLRTEHDELVLHSTFKNASPES